MPSPDNFDIDSMAELARIRLTDDEKKRLGQQLGTIIDYIEHLGRLDTKDVEPTSHVLNVENVFREDDQAASLEKKDFLSLAPASRKGHYEVPKII